MCPAVKKVGHQINTYTSHQTYVFVSSVGHVYFLGRTSRAVLGAFRNDELDFCAAICDSVSQGSNGKCCFSVACSGHKGCDWLDGDSNCPSCGCPAGSQGGPGWAGTELFLQWLIFEEGCCRSPLHLQL